MAAPRAMPSANAVPVSTRRQRAAHSRHSAPPPTWQEVLAGHMEVDIHSGPAFALGEITLPAGGGVRVEAGALAEDPGGGQKFPPPPGGGLEGARRAPRGGRPLLNHL